MPDWFENALRLLLLLMGYAGFNPNAPPPESMQVGPLYGNAMLTPTNQLLTPTQRITFPRRAVDLAINPQGTLLAVLLPDGIRLFTPDGQAVRTISTTPASLMGLQFSPDGETIAASQAATDTPGIAVSPVDGSTKPVSIQMPKGSAPAGLTFDGAGANLYVALNRQNTVVRLNMATRQIAASTDVGIAPLGVALTPAGDRLFVTNWGGRRPASGETTGPTSGSYAVVDARGIARSGSVSVIDTASFKVVAEIPVGLHPGGIQISPDGKLAAVANANSDSVTLLDTGSLTVVDTINIPAFPQGYFGSSPTAVAFSRTGGWLYVACGGNNAVAVLQRSGGTYRLAGQAPTDWYPVALAVAGSGAGETVFVANAKGVEDRAPRSFTVRNALGTVNVFAGGGASSSDAVASANNPFGNAVAPVDSPRDLGKLGMTHCFLIIKENRTYDQVLGDLGKGDGDPKLTQFGASITPNQHALAAQFVTLDNFYASGTISADGHQWLTQSMATDYLERAHSAYPRGQPYAGPDPLAFAGSGFIWNNVMNHGLSVRVYGEFASGTSTHTWAQYLADADAAKMQILENVRPTMPQNTAITDPHYPGFSLNVPDVYRARLFIDQFKQFEQQGTLSNLVILWMPTDHTEGAAPGFASANSMVADNDLAVGRVVDAISHSPDWPHSVIFMVEDDAQDGTDHVDGHRTVCLAIGPFVRRNAVDSTNYNQTSLLRTIEELLGLPPMNKFDGSALPMRSIFTTSPNFASYTAVPNQVPLDQMNPPLSALKGKARQAARESRAMDFSQPDAAPEEKLNRIIWHMAKGWNTPYPKAPHHPWCRPEEDDD